MKKIQLALPWWCATFVGLITIGIISLMAVLVAQAHVIESQARQLKALSDSNDKLYDYVREFQKDREKLLELQEWRVNVTLASRSGWQTAVRRIKEYPLPMPDGVTESTRPRKIDRYLVTKTKEGSDE